MIDVAGAFQRDSVGGLRSALLLRLRRFWRRGLAGFTGLAELAVADWVHHKDLNRRILGKL